MPASTKPTITFLRTRSQNDTFLLHPSVYGIRKQNYTHQIDTVTEFVESKTCRSQSLLSYFGEETVTCGTCDICVRKTNITSELTESILEQLKNKSTIATLMNQLGASETEIIEALDHLQAEELIECSTHEIQRFH